MSTETRTAGQDWRKRLARALHSVSVWRLTPWKEVAETQKEYFYRRADAILRCIEEQGCAILPGEPDASMRVAGINAAYDEEKRGAPLRDSILAAYRAMYAARPR